MDWENGYEESRLKKRSQSVSQCILGPESKTEQRKNMCSVLVRLLLLINLAGGYLHWTGAAAMDMVIFRAEVQKEDPKDY